MKLSEIKKHLTTAEAVTFQLPNGTLVPEHFHVTEVGIFDKHFIDCGGTVRREMVANFQLWNANDLEHRLKPQKLLNIITLSEKVLGMEDLEVEVEYQGETIGKYGIDYDNKKFILTTTKTDCLAKENCGVADKPKVQLQAIEEKQGCCTPRAGCC